MPSRVKSYTLTPSQLTAAQVIAGKWDANRKAARRYIIADAKRRGQQPLPQLLLVKATVAEVLDTLLGWELES